jgi:hypothetical protein
MAEPEKYWFPAKRYGWGRAAVLALGRKVEMSVGLHQRI